MDIWLFIIVVLAMIGSFATGYNAASDAERKARTDLEDRLNAMLVQQGTLTDWVRANWPDAYRAYLKGHAVGYQQGIEQGPYLDEEENA